MSVGAVGAGGSAFETAVMRLETQVSLQKEVQDMAAKEMAAVLQMIAPPPSNLGGGVDVSA